jgi:uncharacterized membrane protein YebE (DUF533 family)
LNNAENILLTDLNGYEVAPPTFLYTNIVQKIDAEDASIKKSLQALIHHSVLPPIGAVDNFNAIFNRIKKEDSLTEFKPLKDYEIASPISFEKIMAIIRSLVGVNNKTQASKVIPIGNYLKKIASVAAVLLVSFLGYRTFQNFDSKKNNPNKEVPNSIVSSSPVVPSTNPTDTDTTSIVGTTRINTVTPSRKIPAFSYAQSYNNVASKGNSNENRRNILYRFTPSPVAQEKLLSIGGSNMPIIENDYLASFAALNETNLPPFLQVDKPIATTITIDDYTDITISEGMGAMMKKMYKTKKSGKPTRRARKTREKLEKWKNADSTYFNANSTANPLDPVDLGNFILQK